jgi:hypothetical protein
VPSERSDGHFGWDQEEADGFVGLVVLVGVTYLAPDGNTVKSQAQYHRRIVSVDREGIEIACGGRWAGKTMTLPPTLSSFHHAGPGEYKLHSTGETIEDPDLAAFFSVTEPLRS